MGRISRVLIAATALAGVLLLPATAGASGVHLDRSFGVRGKVLTAAWKAPSDEGGGFEEPAFDMAAGGKGSVFVLLGNQVLSYQADGSLNRGFGARGRVSVGSQFGGAFEAAAIGVDSQRRLLVAGTYRQPPDPETTAPAGGVDLRPGLAALVRYLPNGELDSSFGVNGVFETDLGLPRPKYGGSGFEYERPSLQVTGLAVDALDRPLITGSWVTDSSQCMLQYIDTRPYVARLTPTGSLDPDFASAGVWIGAAPEDSAAEPIAEPSGGILYSTSIGYGCSGGPGEHSRPERLGSLTGSGAPDAGFDSKQSEDLMEAGTSIAIDRSGRILLAKSSDEPEVKSVVSRLSPDGAPDPSFGHRGSVTVRLPEEADISSLTADSSGRPLLAGSSSLATGKSKEAVGFVLMRLTTAGKPDSGFGHGGALSTRFGAQSVALARQTLSEGDGRMLVGGPVNSPRLANGYGVALARYTSAKQR